MEPVIWAKRTMLAAVAAGGISLLMASAAYSTNFPTLQLDPASGPPGTTVTATGRAFCASCGPVEIDFLAQPVKQGIAVASDGSFQAAFTVPGGAPGGTNAVNAYQQSKIVTQTSYTVTPSTPAPNATPVPQQTSTPLPRQSGTPTPGGGPSAGPQATPTASPAGPSPAQSGRGTGSTPPGAGPAPPTAIVLSALAALLVVAIGAVLLYRRVRSRTFSRE